MDNTRLGLVCITAHYDFLEGNAINMFYYCMSSTLVISRSMCQRIGIFILLPLQSREPTQSQLPCSKHILRTKWRVIVGFLSMGRAPRQTRVFSVSLTKYVNGQTGDEACMGLRKDQRTRYSRNASRRGRHSSAKQQPASDR